MEVSMSLNALVHLPLTKSRVYEDPLTKFSLLSGRKFTFKAPSMDPQRQRYALVVEAKGKKGMQRQRKASPLPKIEDDGNPRFVVFIRMANVYLWYPLSIITGGTTAKIVVVAKDTFIGKHLYKDTLGRNLAAVIYRENGNIKAALTTTDVIELPTKADLKTVLNKVKDFFGEAKDSFGKLTAINSGLTEEAEG